MREINKNVIEEFRANDGQLSGPMEGAPILLLTTTGRKSGNPHTTPIGFLDVGGKLAAAAANGGSDHDPDWLRNISVNNTVVVDVPGATIRSIAEIVTGHDRDQLLGKLAKGLPGMSDHVAATSREIPVVLFSEAT